MDENTFLVSLSMEETAKKIHSAVVDGSITGELLDHYVIRARNSIAHRGRLWLTGGQAIV